MALPLAEKRVPAADLWNLRVVAVDFSLAPHRKFDGITDECVATIRALVAPSAFIVPITGVC